jgi:hypothetical protein
MTDQALSDRQCVRRICVTPVRNEAWIIDRFIAAASRWATDIVVADQGSTDGTLDTLRSSPVVRLVQNTSTTYDEAHRQELLLGRARQIQGRRILIGLDADEALSANYESSDQWHRLETVAPGTIVRLRWVNILPGFKKAWIPPEPRPFGFIDDGAAHNGKRIHSPRVPQPPGAPTIDLDDVVVLHFQYVAWERMVSKHRWYQAWELTRNRERSPLDIFRQYHHMNGSWSSNEIHPINSEWLAGYERAGIDYRSLASEHLTWWDTEVCQMLQEGGPASFSKLDIWDRDWNETARVCGVSRPALSDPRSPFEKLAHGVLRMTQNRRSVPLVRAFEKFLRVRGW